MALHLVKLGQLKGYDPVTADGGCSLPADDVEGSPYYRFALHDDVVEVMGAKLQMGGLPGDQTLLSDMVFTLLMCVLFGLNLLWLDVNRSSLHGFYRDRLTRLYLFARRRDGGVELNDAQLLSTLNPRGSAAPYHLINAALNLHGDAADSSRRTGRLATTSARRSWSREAVRASLGSPTRHRVPFLLGLPRPRGVMTPAGLGGSWAESPDARGSRHAPSGKPNAKAVPLCGGQALLFKDHMSCPCAGSRRWSAVPVAEGTTAQAVGLPPGVEARGVGSMRRSIGLRCANCRSCMPIWASRREAGYRQTMRAGPFAGGCATAAACPAGRGPGAPPGG